MIAIPGSSPRHPPSFALPHAAQVELRPTSIGNGSRVGTTDLGNVMPAGYPAMLDPTCAPTRTLGAWWNFTSVTITLTPDCATPAKPST